MKVLQSIYKAILMLLVMVIFENTGYAQDSTKQASIQNKVAEKDFVFEAQTVLPQRGITRQLNSYYFLRVSKDTLVSDLPYFGRAYSAPINPSEGGIRFTSTSFDYSSRERTKGGWDIIIKPKDINDVQQLVLNVFENGRASLQVISNNRQAISFDGLVRERKTNN
jgi:hypothetical protein